MPQDFFYFLLFAVVVIVFIQIFRNKPSEHINSDGYVFLTDVNELEHRYIAKQLLGRELSSKEVIHHINGRKIDNKISNLCLMDRQKHELFHSWLRWKKEKSGKYPPINIQKKILKQEYNGQLLEDIKSIKSEYTSSEKNRRLFELLKDERRRLAYQNCLPVYMIFNNKTLVEMTHNLPTSETAMLSLKGVGPAKMRSYGYQFIKIIAEFEKTWSEQSSRGKDTA